MQQSGIDAVSVRAVADEAATTTRAIYALFGSKDGLLAALGARAFEMLGSGLRETPTTPNPATDLVDAGAQVFRRLVVEHPILFGIGVQRTAVGSELAARFDAARRDALGELKAKLARLGAAGGLRRVDVDGATLQFHAMCEGLAECELKGLIARDTGATVWRDALGTLVAGFAVPKTAIAVE